MNHDFTFQDILAYVYGELDAERAVQLESLIAQDELLRKEVDLLRETKTLLAGKKVNLFPSEKVMESIRQYASEKTESKFGVGLYQ